MEKDLTRLLIENTLRHALRQSEDSPEREIRNLVDLGLTFSHGRFQTRILSSIQQLLQNPQSAYYTLIRDVLASVDQTRLLTFGINLGYEGCTKGARIIRATEAEGGFNVPWALTVQASGAKMAQEPECYASIFQQGEALGIHTYLLFSKSDLRPLFPLLQQRATSAFILFAWARQVTAEFVAALGPVPNAMVAVRWEPGAAEACRRLRAAGIPYAVLTQYTKQDKESILSGGWVEAVLACRPFCAFLLAAPSCSEKTQQEIYRYVFSARNRQQYPVLLMDLKQDVMMIDQYISDDVCFVAFDALGMLHTNGGLFDADECNIFKHDLQTILHRALKKKAPALLR